MSRSVFANLVNFDYLDFGDLCGRISRDRLHFSYLKLVGSVRIETVRSPEPTLP